MDLKKTLKYTGLCAGVLVLAFGVANVKADDEDSTVTITVATPPLVSTTVAKMAFGSFIAVNHLGAPAACITMSTAGVLDFTAADNGPGGARLIGVAPAPAALNYTLSGPGSPMAMSLQIGNTAGTPIVTLSNPGSGTFLLNTWTVLNNDASNFNGTFNGAAGTGTLTLMAGGLADLNFGGKLCTDTLGTVYANGAYNGTIRVTVNY